jgi:hypothetical protein
MKVKNKNRIFKYFTFSVYKYAPESFQLYFNNKLVKLSEDERYNMGYAAITKRKDEVQKLIKKWVRQKSNLSQEQIKPIMAIASDDNKEYYRINCVVNRYDINEKLRIYKLIKEAFNAGRFNTKITSAKLDANFNPYDVKEVKQEKKLGKRIVFI